MPASNDDVAELLSNSRGAHLAWRKAKAEKNLSEARIQLQNAAEDRAAAHALDPEHTLPAWADELATTKFDHAALTLFYSQQLDKQNG